MLELFWLAGPFLVLRLMWKDGLNQPITPSTSWTRLKYAVAAAWFAMWYDEDEDW